MDISSQCNFILESKFVDNIYIPTDHYRKYHYRGRREFGTNGNARKLITNATQGLYRGLYVL